jgi:hypothetical protein
VSVKAMWDRRALTEIDFLKNREIKDYGSFLLAASFFDIITLGGNFLFMVMWLPGPALAFLLPLFVFLDLYVIIGELNSKRLFFKN